MLRFGESSLEKTRYLNSLEKENLATVGLHSTWQKLAAAEKQLFALYWPFSPQSDVVSNG